MTKSIPESHGVSSRDLAAALTHMDAHVRYPHGFGVVKDGALLCQGLWSPFRREGRHLLHSVSKSVLCMAVGMLADVGLLALGDKVTDYFPEYLPGEYDPRLLEMTVEDLLTMRASTAMFSRSFLAATGSYITHYFGLPLHAPPGTAFSYDTGASFLLSAIASKVAGENVRSFLDKQLFGPMEFGEVLWENTPEKLGGDFVSGGGWGLSLSLEELCKMAVLWLGGGSWQGRQLVPGWWMKTATAKHADTGENQGLGWGYGYGYQFWKGPGGVFIAYGSFGQLILCDPHSGVGVVTLGGCSQKQCEALGTYFMEEFFPKIKNSPLPQNPPALEDLRHVEQSLAFPPAPGGAGSPQGPLEDSYQFPPNEYRLSRLCLAQEQEGVLDCSVTIAGVDYAVSAAHGGWLEAEGRLWSTLPHQAHQESHAFSYGWEDGVLVVLHLFLNDSCLDTYRIRWPEEGGIELHVKRDFTLRPFPALTLFGEKMQPRSIPVS